MAAETVFVPADDRLVIKKKVGTSHRNREILGDDLLQSGHLSRLAYVNTAASTAVTGSTATEQLFDTSYTIPADTLKAGTVVNVRGQGIVTGSTGGDTLAVKLYIGGSAGTALITSAATDAADNQTFLFETSLVVRTVGTTGTFVAAGTYKVPSAEGTMTVKDDVVASTTLNTTANQVVAVTGTWSVANATNTCRLDILSVEIL